MESRLEKKVKAIVCVILGLDESEYNVNSSFYEDLGADSLDAVEIIMEAETVFGISIPDADAEDIKSPADMIEYIKGLGLS